MSSQFGQRIILLLSFCIVTTLHAQTIYYPARCSDLLKLTAQDMATLFSESIPNSNYTIKEYTSQPRSGIILTYDSSMINDQSCRIESDGISLTRFSAAQDAGLCFGVYSYLDELGFRFYLPGKIWQKIPVLTSAFKQENR